jgi:hypothetical protein
MPSVFIALTAATMMSPGIASSTATCSIQLSPGCSSTVSALPPIRAPE